MSATVEAFYLIWGLGQRGRDHLPLGLRSATSSLCASVSSRRFGIKFIFSSNEYSYLSTRLPCAKTQPSKCSQVGREQDRPVPAFVGRSVPLSPRTVPVRILQGRLPGSSAAALTKDTVGLDAPGQMAMLDTQGVSSHLPQRAITQNMPGRWLSDAQTVFLRQTSLADGRTQQGLMVAAGTPWSWGGGWGGQRFKQRRRKGREMSQGKQEKARHTREGQREAWNRRH